MSGGTVGTAGTHTHAGRGSHREQLFKAAVRSGADPMYPTIDYSIEQEELSADEVRRCSLTL